LFGNNRVDLFLRNAKVRNDILVKHAHAAGRNRTHREFFLARYSKLANEEYVKLRVKRACNLESNRHTSARQCEHEHIGAIGVATQSLS